MAVEFSESEVMKIGDAIDGILQALSADQSPEAQTHKKALVEAQQIIAGKVQTDQQQQTASSGPNTGFQSASSS